MYIVIVGAGNLGYYLAKLLTNEEQDVVIIEKEKDKCDKIANDLDVVTINSDATEPKTLEKANINEADAVVALTEHDETNMIICLIAKELGAKKVAAKLRRIEYNEKILKKLGIDIVIHPEAAAAGYIEELITKPDVLDLAFISRGDAEIMEIQIKEDSKIIGKKISEIEHPAGSAIVAVYENNKLTIPEPETKIHLGTKILILAKREIANKVRKMLM